MSSATIQQVASTSLIMVEERPWGTDADQAAQLRAKINSYAGYILDGTLAKQFPETAGQRVRIQLNCWETPSGQFAVITNNAAAQLDKLQIGFNVRVMPSGSKPRT
jgi:hypothetical protein